MHQDELATLIRRTATLMEQFERCCNRIEQRQQVLTDTLQHLAQQVPAAVRQSAEQSLQALPRELLDKVESGLEQPVNAYQQRLHQAGALLGDGSRTLAGQLQRMEKLHRHLAWKIVAVPTASLLLLLVSGIWLSSHYTQVIRQNQISAELLAAYNGGDVTLCEGRLCANVDLQGKAYGDQGQYRPVQPRRARQQE
jgi:hypothetical protein